jgi:hypothetical protein
MGSLMVKNKNGGADVRFPQSLLHLQAFGSEGGDRERLTVWRCHVQACGATTTHEDVHRTVAEVAKAVLDACVRSQQSEGHS